MIKATESTLGIVLWMTQYFLLHKLWRRFQVKQVWEWMCALQKPVNKNHKCKKKRLLNRCFSDVYACSKAKTIFSNKIFIRVDGIHKTNTKRKIYFICRLFLFRTSSRLMFKVKPVHLFICLLIRNPKCQPTWTLIRRGKPSFSSSLILFQFTWAWVELK